VGARHTLGAAAPGSDPERLIRDEGLGEGSRWSNGPGDRYGAHSHTSHKVLYCAEGSITFHTDDGDIVMHPGDRLDLEPGTEHWATVGPGGVTCVEAYRE
jgi:quercetin dioxygenase-like cupin family protein